MVSLDTAHAVGQLDVTIALRPDEVERLAALDRYKILDSPREADFDDIAELASDICGTPIAVVNLIGDGRQFFMAEVGLGVRETPLDTSFCGHAILEDDFMLIPDASTDNRFNCNPLVIGAPGLRFYAGALLKTEEGLPLGTLCVLDVKPRDLTDHQQNALRKLARQVMAQLELRRALATQRRVEETLRSEEMRHRRILESAIDYGIITMDLHGLVTSWNEGAHRILGWTEHEMCGRLCDEFFTPEDRAAGVPSKEMGAALRTGRGTDERWHLRKDGSRFWASGEMMPLTDEAGSPVGFLKILRDRTEARLSQDALKISEESAERDRRLLTGELEHRVKNILSLVQAIVSQSLRTATTPAEARMAIEDRLVSLGRAHDLLTQSNWEAAPIRAVIANATKFYGGGQDRISASGPDFRITARAAVGLALALHELTTNAAKYGALSNSSGHVQISWSTSGTGDDEQFELIWRESGGPAVAPPQRTGFGSRLINASLTGGRDNHSSIDYLGSGVLWRTCGALSAIRDQ